MSAAASPEKLLARSLMDAVYSGASGLLRAERGKLRRMFCLEKGFLIFAASNVIEEQFGEYLVRGKLLEESAKNAIVEEARTRKKKFAEVLREHRLVDEELLRRAMDGLVRSLLSSTLEWPDGECHFEVGRPNVATEFTVWLAPAGLLLEHARHHPASIDALRVRLGPPDARPAIDPARTALLDEIPVDDATRFLLEHCDGERTVGEIANDSPAGAESTLRALYGLMLVGVAAVSTIRDVPRDGGKEPALGREECLAVLSRAEGADHYAVLGLGRNCPQDLIRSAYYSLARRYHPDRFRAGSLRDLLPRFERYFTKVTEAYNTLHNEKLREEYDRQLASALPEPETAKQSETSYLARQNFLRGKALMEKRRYAEASVFFENAVQLDATQTEYHFELGSVLARNPRRRADAERHLLRAAEMAPAATAPYIALGDLYARAGRDADAARMYREALRWDPGHAEASARLAELGNVPEDREGAALRRRLGD